MLALDPAPKVARLGRDVLRIAQYELSFAAAGGGGGAGGGGAYGANGSLSPRRGESGVGELGAAAAAGRAVYAG